MKNRILCLLCGSIYPLFIIVLMHIPEHFINYVFGCATIFLFICFIYILGFLMMLTIYKAQDKSEKDIEQLIRDFLFWVKENESQL